MATLQMGVAPPLHADMVINLFVAATGTQLLAARLFAISGALNAYEDEELQQHSQSVSCKQNCCAAMILRKLCTACC